jgi:exopolyphosphatase/guanosine-5'-triphosphate,3'-diphosphate pyrophosphatase
VRFPLARKMTNYISWPSFFGIALIIRNQVQRLDSAIRLHEIGLSLAHDDFHKHGSYILENSDMAGFSKLEQKYLSFLVLNQRRKLNPMPNTYGFAPNWDLVLIMRLACLLNRRRDNDNAQKGIHLLFFPEGASLTLDKDWAKDHPLTMDLLNKEKNIYYNKIIFSMSAKPQAPKYLI